MSVDSFPSLLEISAFFSLPYWARNDLVCSELISDVVFPLYRLTSGVASSSFGVSDSLRVEFIGEDRYYPFSSLLDPLIWSVSDVALPFKYPLYGSSLLNVSCMFPVDGSYIRLHIDSLLGAFPSSLEEVVFDGIADVSLFSNRKEILFSSELEYLLKLYGFVWRLYIEVTTPSIFDFLMFHPKFEEVDGENIICIGSPIQMVRFQQKYNKFARYGSFIPLKEITGVLRRRKAPMRIGTLSLLEGDFVILYKRTI